MRSSEVLARFPAAQGVLAWLRGPVVSTILRFVLIFLACEDTLINLEDFLRGVGVEGMDQHPGLLQWEWARIVTVAVTSAALALRGKLGRVPFPVIGSVFAVAMYVLTGGWIQLCVAVYFLIVDVRRFVAPLVVLLAAWFAARLFVPLEFATGLAWWTNGIEYFALSAFVAMVVRRSHHLNSSLALATVEHRELLRQEAELRHRDEKVRISQRIHDELGHYLTALYMRATALKMGKVDDVEAIVDDMASDAQKGLQSLRETVRSLSATDAARSQRVRENLGDLESMVRGLRSTGMTIEVSRQGPIAELTADTQELAFMIVRESLTNAIKHAPGATVRVWLSATEEELTVTVENTEPQRISSPKLPSGGMGLRGLGQRVEQRGGRFSARMTASGGFATTASIPLVTNATSAITEVR